MENLHSYELAEFGRILKRLRLKADLTQAALAKLIRVRRHSLINWENGEGCPAEPHLRRLIAVFIAWRVFTSGKEREEATHLWQLVSLAGAGQVGEFDNSWFSWLLSAPDNQPI